MNDLGPKTADNLRKVRESKPLVHNITNFVVMNFTANVLLASGASPVMAHAENEVEEMVDLAGALVLNIGTLSDSWIAAMSKAGSRATARQTPIVLDPVGAGATALRTATARRLLAACQVSVLRGNASEILALADSGGRTRGVDSCHGVEAVAATARHLADTGKTTVAVTGPVDLVTDGRRSLLVANGHPLLPAVTGTGCAATALIGAFLAVDPDPLTAAATALAFFGIAGEAAGIQASGPGSFTVQLLDALYRLSPEEVIERCRISVG
jgi:hydroxyethylthiazole kinase